MKILQICAYAAPYAGNFINSLLALDNELEKMGHETVYAFCHTAQEKPWCKELMKKRKVYFLPLAKARILPKTYSQVKKILRDEDIDIVHSHFELYDLPLALTKPKKTVMFWHLHDAIANGYDKLPFYRKALKKIHYGMVSKNAILCSVSQKHMDFAFKLGFNRDNARLMLNGADLSRVYEKETKEKKYDFLIFAWDYLRKGGDIAIEAAKKLSAQGKSFTIGFVGNDPLWEREDIKAVMNEPWFVKQEFVADVNDLYNGAKAFLHISRAEGCSYALQEACFAGLPVISSDIDENLFINDVPTVKYVKVNDAGDVCRAMGEMIDCDFYVSDEEKQLAKQIIRDKYSLEAWVKNMIKMYRECAGLK